MTNKINKEIADSIINKEIAEAIKNQIGNKALYMMGTKNMSYIKNGIAIRFTGSRKVNYIEIIWNGLDLYEVVFYQIRKEKAKAINTVKNLYCDQLKGLIEKETGLYLSL